MLAVGDGELRNRDTRAVASTVTIPVWLAVVLGVLALIALIDRLLAGFAKVEVAGLTRRGLYLKMDRLRVS